MLKKIERKKYVMSDGVTQSMLATFLKCRQHSRFYLDGWDSIFSSQSANRGDLFHTLLEHWYKKRVTQQNVNIFTHRIWSEWLEKLKKAGPINSQAMEDTTATASAVFPQYVAHWRKSDTKFEWQALEMVFDVMWKGFRLRGKIDGLLKINGKYWLFETKTKATIEEEAMIDILSFDFQNLFYLTVLKELGTPCVGVIYNIIRKPNLKIKKSEDLREFTARIEADVIERPDHYFKRYEIAYPRQTIDQFQGELFDKLIDFKLWVEGKLPTYRNETSCIGRIKCPFLKACSSGKMIGYKQNRVLFRELLT